MLDRRRFLAVVGASAFTAACQSGPKNPSAVTVAASGGPGMNPGPDGGGRPVTLMLMRLKSVGAFNSADLFALQSDPAAVLGADLVGVDQLVVAPGAQASKSLTFEPEAAYLGVVALLRDPSGKTWRAVKAVPQESTIVVPVTVGAGGITV